MRHIWETRAFVDLPTICVVLSISHSWITCYSPILRMAASVFTTRPAIGTLNQSQDGVCKTVFPSDHDHIDTQKTVMQSRFSKRFARFRLDLRNAIGTTKLLCGSGLLSLAGYLIVALLGDVRPHVFSFLALYGMLFLLYAFAVWRILAAKHDETEKQSRPIDLLWILGCAVAFRVLLLPGYPFLTDDIYRYLWDGRVWSLGINPYLHAPASEALAAIRDAELHPNINHPQIPTIYAPLLQFLFRLVYEISPTFWFLKTAVTAFDLGAMAVLLALLKILNLNRRLLLIYAWNPLVIVETAGSGHIDVVGVFWLLLFFLFYLRKMSVPAACALAAATLTKFIAIILVPFVFLRFKRKHSALFCVVFAISIVVAYWPFIDAGTGLFKALNVYTTKWLFNASLFRLVHAAVAFIHPSDNLDANLMIVKIILAAVWGGLFIVLFWRRTKSGYAHQDAAILHEWFWLFGAICVFTPTLHPWYLIWLVPVLAFYQSRAWLALTGLIFLSYVILQNYYQTGIWQESTITLLLIYLPFYAILIYDFAVGRRTLKTGDRVQSGRE